MYRIDTCCWCMSWMRLKACTGHICWQTKTMGRILKTVSNRKEMVSKNFAIKWAGMFGSGNGNKVCKSAVDCLGIWGIEEGVCLRHAGYCTCVFEMCADCDISVMSRCNADKAAFGAMAWGNKLPGTVGNNCCKSLHFTGSEVDDPVAGDELTVSLQWLIILLSLMTPNP